MNARVPNLVALVRFLRWAWDGRVCIKCKEYRTGRRFNDDLCDVCAIIETIRRVMRS